MKTGCLLFIFSCFSGVLAAQQVNLLTLEQMEERFKTGGDTTYVVNFWATWCGPCVKELPYFEKLQHDYREQPVKVLLVSLDFRSKLEEKVKPFVKEKDLQSEVFLLNESNQQEYIDAISPDWSGAIPATLFVNNGKQVRTFREQEFTYDELQELVMSL